MEMQRGMLVLAWGCRLVCLPPAKREMYLRPEASWRRMLTQQPPVFTVGLFSMGAGFHL
jgi:hypothetical protein